MVGRDAALIALLAILARVGAQMALGFYQAPETFEEGEIALRLARGDGYAYEINGATVYALRGPTYAFLLAGLYVVFGSTAIVAGIAQAILGGILAATCYAMGATWWSRPAGVLAGVAAALHPALLIYATKIHQLNLDAVLVVLGALVLTVAPRSPRVITAACIGALAGLALLSRATLAPFLGLGTLVIPGLRTSRRAGLVAVALLVSLAVVAPWVARNQAIVGEATLTTTTGYLLWIGNNPHATGTTLAADGRPMLEASPEVRDRIWGLSEREQDRIFLSLAIDHIVADPPAATAALVRKLISFWWFGPSAGTLYPRSWLILYAALYVLLVLLSLSGAVAAVRRRMAWPLVVIVLACVTVSLLQSLFYVDGRHRWAVEPLLLVLAAIGTVELWSACKDLIRPPWLRSRLAR